MTIQHSPTTLRKLLSDVSNKLSIPTPFKLTLVKKRPARAENTKMIKLSRYDMKQELNPALEFDKVRDSLKLPQLSIENTTRPDKLLAPHTLHMLIALEELKLVPDYAKRLAAIGYQPMINTQNHQLFVYTSKSQAKIKINYLNTSNDDLQETLLLRNLFQKHPGIQNTYAQKVFNPTDIDHSFDMPSELT